MPNPLDNSVMSDNALSYNAYPSYDVEGGSKIDAFFHPEKYEAKTVLKDGLQPEDPMLLELAKKYGLSLNDSTKDYLTQFYVNEQSNKTAWERTLEADRTKYQRAVEDIKAAGLNPVQVLGGFGGSSPSASNSSVSSGFYTENKKTNLTQGVKAGLGVAAVLVAIVGAAVKAMG